MLPPIPLKQLLCSRAICSAVIDRIVFESVDSGIATTVSDISDTGPVEFIYAGIAIYYVYSYFVEHKSKKTKIEKLREYVLPNSVYRAINTFVFVIFLLIKNPANAI